MRFIAVDWGTSRARAFLVKDGQALDQVASDEGISHLKAGQHQAVFARLCGRWLDAEPELPVLLSGMVGSREGWFPAPYVVCPAGPREIAGALLPVDLGAGRRGHVVPGLRAPDAEPADVMRGEETHLLGSEVTDGLVCLPGTHCKWAEMRDGRIAGFSTFITGEAYGLLREHSMIGRPAAEPADPKGFGAGVEAAGRAQTAGDLLHLLFEARAMTVTGRLSAEALGPYLSGLLTGAEVAGALARYRATDRAGPVAVVAGAERASLYRTVLARHGIETSVVDPGATLARGASLIMETFARSSRPSLRGSPKASTRNP